MKRMIIILLIVSTLAGNSFAKVDLVTLPSRDTVQVTIYNSADLTLVRESRALMLKEGKNSLQFSWVNTLIDPTSLELLPKKFADKIDIADLTFPPRVRNLGLWNIDSGIAGKVPMEILYLTSGLSWRAFYMGTLAEDESSMRLQGYVRVTNNSGEDYENAQTRLIVGKVHILDRIADLARRQWPYGRPGQIRPPLSTFSLDFKEGRRGEYFGEYFKGAEEAPKEIMKEGLSEYFLYTIEGTETIATGWSKRLISFDVEDVPVVNLYKYEEQRYGPSVVRFLSFKNDKDHRLGDTPIPGGMLKVYRTVDQQQHLGYVGQSAFKYIPVDEDVELNLGLVSGVIVEAKLMDFKTDNYRFNNKGNISGWDEIRRFKIEVKNSKNIPVKVEVLRNFNTSYWDIKNNGDFGKFEKVDKDTVKYELELKSQSEKKFEYVLTTYHKVRQQDQYKSKARENVQDEIPQQVMETRIYHVAFLFDKLSAFYGFDQSGKDDKYREQIEMLSEWLEDFIVNTIEPDSWFLTGAGEGTITMFEKKLVILQSSAVHSKILKLLQDLKKQPTDTLESWIRVK